MIGYLPVLYQAFSRREVTISLLDARGGSPPSARQILLRLANAHHVQAITPFLSEVGTAGQGEVPESHLSYPVLSYYRSQHDNQSWLAALTAVLDTCSLLIAGVKGVDPYQAQMTFAMARHAVVDLALIFQTQTAAKCSERLSASDASSGNGCKFFCAMPACPSRKARPVPLSGANYEPYMNLSWLPWADFFSCPCRHFLPDIIPIDNWQTSPLRSSVLRASASCRCPGEHFE